MRRLVFLAFCLVMVCAPAWAGIYAYEANDMPNEAPPPLWKVDQSTTNQAEGVITTDPPDAGSVYYFDGATIAGGKYFWGIDSIMEQLPAFDPNVGVTIVARAKCTPPSDAVYGRKLRIGFNYSDASNYINVQYDATGQLIDLRYPEPQTTYRVSEGYHTYRITWRTYEGEDGPTDIHNVCRVYVDEDTTVRLQHDGNTSASARFIGPQIGITGSSKEGLYLDWLVFDATGPYAPGEKILILGGPKCVVSGTNATITWTTDQASDSTVYYGTNPDSLSLNVSNASEVTNHTVNLSSLTTNQVWYYKVVSAKSGWTSADSGLRSMNVSAVAGPTVSPIDTTSARLEWKTDYASDATLSYGTDPGNLNNVVTNPDARWCHSFVLTSLSVDTPYYYKAESQDTDHLQYAQAQSFTTPEPSVSYDLYNADMWTPDETRYYCQAGPPYFGFSQLFTPANITPPIDADRLNEVFGSFGFQLQYWMGFDLRVSLYKWAGGWAATTTTTPINTWTVERVGCYPKPPDDHISDWFMFDLRGGSTPSYPQLVNDSYMWRVEILEGEVKLETSLFHCWITSTDDEDLTNRAYETSGNPKPWDYGTRLFNPTPPPTWLGTVDEAKKAAHGNPVEITGATVSAVFRGDGATYAGFAIEEPDTGSGESKTYGRYNGIRVIPGASNLELGDQVTIKGYAVTLDGERVIQSIVVTETSSGGPAPPSFGIANVDTGGATYGGQGAVVNDAM
ncbi:MAG TPA: hypothetical protein VMX94_11745, partial [Armatimonadota bacterium]|nr:hypothetical protein [Armatimonadota bacterium]